MLLKADAAQIEWRCKAFLSRDEVALQEIWDKRDIHTENESTFGLPSRLIAKIFIYRMIFANAFGPQGYRLPAYAYSSDPDFAVASTSAKYWEKVIDKFFNKYKGIYDHGVTLIQTAIRDGVIISPLGRFYKYQQLPNGEWPITDILNYLVQGFAADLMVLARQMLYRRIADLPFREKVLIVNTVHDDIELDVDNDKKVIYTVCEILMKCFSDIPDMAHKMYGVTLDVPQECEIKLGNSLLEASMIKYPKWRELNAI